MKKDHPGLSVRRQRSLLSLARSNLDYQPRGESAETLAFMAIIDRQFPETPCYGARQPPGTLLRNALPVSGWPATCEGKGINAGGIATGGECGWCRSSGRRRPAGNTRRTRYILIF
ncbi:hypothetical protein [Mangrovicoccus algicola]|uniref:hypothetical protein n=1 Tax=Mangrovicoccus algicola TaxID=2771008 RepID=UPI0038B3C16D